MAEFSTGNGFPDVVVTGVAMTTALATDADSSWKKLLDGQSGIRKLDDPFVEQFDLPVRIGGHLQEDFDHQLTRVELHRFLFLQKMATVVGRRVWANAGSPEVDSNRLMVSIGTAMGSGVALADDHTPNWQHSSYDRQPQAHGRVSHHPPPRYRNDWHGYNRGYPYRDPYDSYAPPPVVYAPAPPPPPVVYAPAPSLDIVVPIHIR